MFILSNSIVLQRSQRSPSVLSFFLEFRQNNDNIGFFGLLLHFYVNFRQVRRLFQKMSSERQTKVTILFSVIELGYMPIFSSIGHFAAVLWTFWEGWVENFGYG